MWNCFSSNSSWTVGNGYSVSFWHDHWLDSMGPLIAYVVNDLPPAICKLTLKDMVSVDGCWKWSLFKQWLPNFVCEAIAGFNPPMYDAKTPLCMMQDLIR